MVAFFPLFNAMQDKDLKSMLLESGSSNLAWESLCDYFTQETPGHELDLSIDFTNNAKLEPGSNFPRLYKRLGHITPK